MQRRAPAGARWLTCDQCPRDPWPHLRTTTIVASPGAAARRRPSAANRVTKVDSATAILGTLRQVAARPFRRLHAPELLPAVYAGVMDGDGLKQRVSQDQEVAA